MQYFVSLVELLIMNDYQISHEELGKLTRSMRNSTFRDELSSYVDERSDPKHRKEEDQFWDESARNGSIPSGNVIIKPKSAFVARTKLRLSNGAFMNFYINVSSSPCLKDIEFEKVNGGSNISMPQVFSEARLDRESDSDETCQTCVSCVSYKTMMMAQAMPELKEIIIDQTINVMKQKFVGEGECLSPDYQILSMKCKGDTPRFCLCPFDYLVKEYKKFSSKDIVYPNMEAPADAPEVVTPHQIESMQRRAKKNLKNNKSSEESEINLDTPVEEESNNLSSNSTQNILNQKKTHTAVHIKASATSPLAPATSFLKPASFAVDDEKGCEISIVEGQIITATPTDVPLLATEDSSLPKHLTVRIRLPNVTSASNINCDVIEDGTLLTVHVPGLFAAEKKLNYIVNNSAAKAQFVKSTSELVLTLPVLRRISQMEGKENVVAIN